MSDHSKFIKLEILDFGEIQDGFYVNKIVNWNFKIPENFSVKLKSKEERVFNYQRATSGILMNSHKEINEMLSWTELIKLKKNDDKCFFEAYIKQKGKTIRKDFQLVFEHQVNSIKEHWKIKKDFSYKVGEILLGEIKYDYIAFSEINYLNGSSFGIPSIHYYGIYNDLVIKFIIAYLNPLDKKEVIETIWS